MTLIISALAEDVIIQVSDRLVTWPDGRVWSDNATKVVCVECADAAFTVAYTGLALIGNVRTDRWIVNALNRNGATNKRFPDLFQDFHTSAARTSSDLRELGVASRNITFVFAGFGRPGPFAAYLTNQEDQSGKSLNEINDDFIAGAFFLNRRPRRKFDLLVNGDERAITEPLRVAIDKVRSRYFDSRPQRRVDVLVEVLRRASRNSKRIGRNCMSTIQLPGSGWFAQYHTENQEAISYVPHYVGRGFAARDIWIRTARRSR